MGRSDLSKLMTRAKGMNGYNNSGINSDDELLDFFNVALTYAPLVQELDIRDSTTINFVEGTDEYDLPQDYFAPVQLKDDNDQLVGPYKDNGFNISGGYSYNAGYDIKNKGSKWVITFPLVIPPKTYSLEYVRYPAELTATSDVPEIPTGIETGLCYLAIHFALLNNNQYGQAQEMERKFVTEISNARVLNFKARGL